MLQTNTHPFSLNQQIPLVHHIGFILIFINVGVLIGWIYNIPFLISFFPLWMSVKVNTAVCFILSGIVLLLFGHASRLVRYIAYLLIFIVFLISVATILEYIFNINLGFDELLITDDTHEISIYPGRMALVTALSFLLVTFAFIFKKVSLAISQASALLVLFVGLFSFYNYVFSANPNYALTVYTTMAAQTTLSFILLSIGILLSNPVSNMIQIVMKNTTGGYYLRRILPTILLVPMLIAIAENRLEMAGIVEGNIGDSIIAAGTFVILGIIISIIVRKIDNEEIKLISATKQIQQNEMIFHQFLENIDIVFYRTSPDLSQILFVSPAYEKIWGKSSESLYKNPQEWFDSILPEDQANVYAEFFEGFRKGKLTAYAEFKIKKPDGTIRNILSRGFQLKDSNNQPFCMTGIAVDMTSIKQEKRYSQDRDNILKILESEKHITELAPKILNLLCLMLNFELGEVWLIDPTKNCLRFVSDWHIQNKEIDDYNKTNHAQTFKRGEGFPGKIWQEMKAVWLPTYSKMSEYPRSFDAEKSGLNCALGIPIIFKEQVFGVMQFFSKEIITPDEIMLSQLNHIAKLLGEYIYRTHTQEKIQSLSHYDTLTGLLTRSALEGSLNTIINHIKYESIAILIVDIDNFKLVNEALGHDKGDLIIKTAAGRLHHLLNPNESHAARLGADKFILYYFKIKSPDDILDYADQIQKSLSEPFVIDDQEISLTTSIGIAIYPQDGINSKMLITNADLALTYAKKDGGNKNIFFNKTLPSLAVEKLAMHIDLQQAISKNQFIIYYQPQVNLKTGKICGAEALVRWLHPIKGIISPSSFIHYAEQSGLIVALNEHIMSLVFEQVRLG